MIECIKGDLTKLKVDAIVNAANRSLLGGRGVDGAIHRAAGKELLEECKTLHGCQTGQVKITKGYNLPAKYVIHTVGPIYEASEQNVLDLANCYTNSLDLAFENKLHSIAFPGISTGVYGYPIDEAYPIAIGVIRKWLADHKEYKMHVILCCFGEQSYQLATELIMSKTMDT